VAVLGILLFNIIDFGLPLRAYTDPTVAGGATGSDLTLWFVTAILFSGKMRAIFSMLFCAGVIMLPSRAEQRGASQHIADVYYRPTLWLITFGLIHAYFLWHRGILYAYGVAGLLLPGMTMFARIDFGRHMVAWLATHKLKQMVRPEVWML
jgi:uncharacterized protein